jgi:hypothetical protein
MASSERTIFWCSVVRLTDSVGRAIAHETSRRLLTATDWVRNQVRSFGIGGAQYGTGTGFFRVLRFTLPIVIPPTAPHSSSIILAGTIDDLVTDVPSGFGLTPPQELTTHSVCL